MADLSKVNVLGISYNLKDAQGRADLAALIASLGNAAKKDVNSTLEGIVAGDIVDGVTLKSYIDSQVGAINKFDVVVADALPKAEAKTMYKLYLIPKTGSKEDNNAKEEWITVRSGNENSYTYAWEKIGDTEIDLSGYVEKTQKVAGIDLQDDITVGELETALNLKALAHAATASGQVEGQTISGVKATGDLSATLTGALGAETVAATIAEKADYTPSGTITGSAISGGSISVTVKDATAKSEAALTYGAYTPAGSVSLTKDNNGAFQVSGTIDKPAINVNDDSVDTFVKSLKPGDVDAASFVEGKFTPASINAGFFSAGSQASYEHTGFDGGKLEKGNAVQAAIEGVVASIGSGEDAETLILTAAQKDNVMDFDAAFTAATYGTDNFVANTLPSIDVSKFNGGSKAADTFSTNKLPVVDAKASAVTAVTAELATAPVFTGDKFAPAFAGTEVAEMKVTKAEYFKQEIGEASFTGTAATLGFTGTTAAELIPTAINYDKTTLGTLGASAALPEGGLTVGDIEVAAKNVTVNAD